MSAPMVPKMDFNAEEVLDEIRQEVSTYHAGVKKRSTTFTFVSSPLLFGWRCFVPCN